VEYQLEFSQFFISVFSLFQLINRPIVEITKINAEKNLKTTPGSDCALNTLAIDEPLEYARLYLDGNMQMWVDAEDSLEL
jgi:hypothetical protein